MAAGGKRLRDRSTGDLLVLMVAGTVCLTVVGGGATLITLEFIHPEIDTSAAIRSITNIINTLIGLLAGFLAGRTDYTIKQGEDKNKEAE